MAGLGIVVVPLVAISVPGPESTGLILPLLIVADCIAVFSYLRSYKWRIILKLTPLTAIGVILGYFIMEWLPRDIFGPVLGSVILLLLTIGVIIEKRSISASGNQILTWLVGIWAGISSMIANAAGPLMEMQFINVSLFITIVRVAAFLSALKLIWG